MQNALGHGTQCALVLAAAFMAGLVVTVSPAEAINCKGRYQVVQGNLLSTPYCEDNYLAQVARGYGTRVSARQIRNNPHRKAEVCRHIGHDNRISDICLGYRNDGFPGLGR